MYSACPNALETVKVKGSHLAAICVTKAEDGCLRSRNAVAMLIDQESIVGAVDRVYSTVRWSRISIFSTVLSGR
jgi:hypothetical protein